MSTVNSFSRVVCRSFMLSSLAIAAFAAQPIVKTVPWVATDSSVPHDAVAFKAVTLKGTSSLQGAGIHATWDFGDGSPTVTSTVTNAYDVSTTHAYSGVAGTTYNARLTVTDSSTGEYSFADYPVAVRDATLDVLVNVAIDEGLWYLHRSMNRTDTSGDWLGTACYACDVTGEATAWNLLAFERQGHLAIGDAADPYTETVARAHAAVLVQVSSQQPKGAVFARAAGIAAQADTQGSAAAAADTTPAIAAADPGTLVARQNPLGYWLGNNPVSAAGFETGQALYALTATPVRLAGVNSVTNVSSQVQVTNTGFTFNRATGTYSGNLTVKNISASTLAAPITVGITNLPAGVTLSNSNGTFNTAPYRSITPLPMLAGASVTVPIVFSNPANTPITFSRFTYSGVFPPAALTLACPANTGTVNTAYNSTSDANGGVLAYTFSISVGALPAGLNINATTGAITGTPTTAGNVNFTVLVTDAAGQNGQTVSQPCSINVAPDTTPQTITFTSSAPGAATVGGPTYVPAATATSGLPVTLTIDALSTGICSISGGVVSFQSPGTCIVDANQAGNATYSAAPQVQQSFTVGKGNQTISFTSTAPVGATVGGATYNVTATATSGLAVAFTSNTPTICTIAGSAVSFIAVGTCTINANQAGNANYNVAPQVQQSFAVAKGNQTITFTSTPPPTPTVGGPTYNVTATATSGLAVTFTIDGSSAGICSIAGSTVTFLASGDCIINANQAGNANYNAATQAQQTIGVGKSSQTISFTSTAPAAATVGGATYNVTATATSGLTVTFTSNTPAVCGVSGSTVSFLTAGTCTINANQAGNASFNAAPQVQQSFAVGQGTQTISFTSIAPAGAIVGGPTYNVTATATSGLTVVFTSNTPAVCGVSGSTVSFLTAGTCVINANQAGNANFSAAPQAQQSFAVGKGNQTITITSVAPVGATVGGSTYNVTATATSGLTVVFTSNTPAICTVAGSTVSFTAAGTCTINANQAGDANYNAAPQVQQSVSVAKGNQTISFTSTAPSNALIGVGNYTPTATATSGLTVTLTIDAGSAAVCAISGGVVTFTAGGTCTINANQAGNANYNPAVQVQQSFQVNQPPAITSLNAVTFKPGLPGQSFTVTTTGFPSGASMVISQTGALPGGVNFTNNNNGTATINGTPASGTAGSSGTPPSQIYPLVITANNGIAPNAVQNPFNLTIACPTITVSGGPTSPWVRVFSVGATGTAFTQTGGSATITWSATGLPATLSIDPSTGVITGTPTVTGTFNVTVTATDAGGCIGTKALVVAVGPNIATISYTGVGNTQFFVTGAAGAPTTPAVASALGLLNGATPAGQVVVTNATCSVGGTLTAVDGAGRFIFTPNVSATSATCAYTATSNTGAGSTGAASTTASLTFTLNNKVWYVTHGASGGDGRSNLPFGDFGAAANQLNCTATTATSDFIYVAQGSANTTGACVLKASQSLIGAGATLTVGPLIVAGAAASTPTLTGTITLANSVTVNGIDMSTGSSGAIVGTSVTGVNVTPRDVTSTTGTAVSIGGTGNTGTYSFRSISANGAANGISLTNTSGSFTVTGNSGTCTNANTTGCSGGTIQNTTGADGATAGAGVYLSNAQNVSLTRMFIHDHQNFAIRGLTVSGFTLNNSVINGSNGNNTGFDEGSIIFDGLTGTSSLANNEIRGTIEDNLRVRNSSGTADITVNANTFTNAPNDNITLEPSSTAVMTAHVTNNTFTGAGGDHMQTATTNTATLNIVFTGNFWSNGLAGSLGGGLTISGGNAGSAEHVNFNVSNNGSSGNPLVGTVQGGALNINQGNGNGIWQGQVSNNFVGNAGVANSGAAQSSGIRVENHSNGSMTAVVNANTIRQWNSGPAINSQSGEVGNSDILNITVTNNSAASPGVNAQHGYVGNFGAGVAGTDASQVCADIATNTLDGNAATGGSGVRIRHRAISSVKIPGYTGTQYNTAAVITFETTKNPGSTPAPTASTTSTGAGFSNTAGGAACAQPTVPN